MNVTERLARYVVETEYSSLPQPVVSEAKRSLLNWMGVAIGASRHPSVEMVLSMAQERGGHQECTLLGRTERTDLLFSALINGMSSHIFDFDDTHLATIIHPSGPVAPVVLALGEKFHSSGPEVLLAFVLGIEVECRIGRMVYPSHYDVGWHITGTVGTFGAAAAAGKMLGLSLEQMQHALGLAATQAAGFREMFGTMSKPFHPGKAAMNGLLGALLAQKGFTSSRQGIEAPRGFARVTSTATDLDTALEDLGERYEILQNTYKPYACGVVSHPVIDACIRLRNMYGVSYTEVQEILCRVNPLVIELTGKTHPLNGLEGKFSSYHSAAVALVDGEAGVRQYTDERVLSPEITEVRQRVQFQVDATIHEDECRLKARLKDGRELVVHVEHATGSLSSPMTEIQIEQKFASLAAQCLDNTRVTCVMALTRELEHLSDVNALLREVVPGE